MKTAWQFRFVSVLLLMTAGLTGTANAQLDGRYQAAVNDAKSAMMVDPDRAVQRAMEVERLARDMRSKDRPMALATAEWLEAEGLLRSEQTAKAGKLIRTALARINPSQITQLRGELLISKGKQASESGKMAEALDAYQTAYDIFQRLDDSRSRARVLINMAVIYDEAYDHAGAIRYYKQALDAYGGDPLLSYFVVGNLGQTLKEERKFGEAEDQTKRALALARRVGSPAMIVHTLDTLARIYLAQGKVAPADHVITQAERLVHSEDDEYGSLLATAAQAAFQHGRVMQAVGLIGRSFQGVDPTRTPLAMRERHETAYDVYRAVGDSRNALIHLAAMKRLDDEATRLATSTNAALMGARFDYANQELRIAKLKADEADRSLTFERARSRIQRWTFVGIISVIAVGMSLLALGARKLRLSRNQVARANVVLEDTNAALGKALAAKTEFLATTSHEIRTPLNGILGMTQVMLADHAVDAGMRDRIGIVHTAGLTMRSLVDDILDVAKMETGHLTVDRAPLNLCTTLSDLAKLWREQAHAKGLVFEADLDDCPAWIEGDAGRLRQIVANLLGNAVKFTERGTVSLRAWRVQGEALRYRVAIADSGIGIAADKLDEVFESFRQGDTSTTRRFGGTGLGLAISRRLARTMDGDVTVTSEPGAGSVFTLDLPLVVLEAPSDVPAASTDVGMLVVERNPITRGMYRALLTPLFGEIAFAASLAEASAALARGGVKRVLADDATLRETDALEAAVAAIAAFGVPVSLLWAPRPGERQDLLIERGAARVVAKPVAHATLIRLLSDNIDQPVDELVCRAA